MIRRGFGSALPEQDFGCFVRLDRTMGNRVMPQSLSLMRDPQGSVQPLFHRYPLCPEVILDLIEHPVVRHGKVVAQSPLGLDAQDPIEIQTRGDRPVQIRRLGG